MKIAEQKKALATAVAAARKAGQLIRQNHRRVKTVNSETQHDIKLELDVRCQKLIEKIVLKALPESAILGEEDSSGAANAELRWVIDPIDGTVNFSYGIPHVSVSIALQRRVHISAKSSAASEVVYETIVGVVYDPFCDEMWTAIRGQAAKLNGIPIRVSQRNKLDNAIISMGFAKSKETVEKTLPYFVRVVPRVRKMRIMGSAALALVYVASGRFDAYVEGGISLWDIAAGGLILECAGGEFWHEPNGKEFGYRILASNGLLRKPLERLA